jgi:hypothetical protein
VDTDIFYETTKTYPIINNFHKVGWQYSSISNVATLYTFYSNYPHYFVSLQNIWINGTMYPINSIVDGKTIKVILPAAPSSTGSIYSTQIESDQTNSTDANVVLNNDTQNTEYNAFCYGNGLESDRIRDSFNNATIKYSIRASSIIDDYEQEEKFASLSYSGVYRGSSSINKLNEFNLSLANFKNLEKDYGSIQKLYTRDSDLLVLHQDKITSVLFGKNLLVDALGGGQVASIPEVLGNQVPYDVDNGISNDPASFAVNSNNLYFTDAKRGAVIEIVGNQGVMEISSKGMRNYLRDLLTDNIYFQKIGAYDPYYNMYTLTTNEVKNTPCLLSISRNDAVFSNNGTVVSISLFAITSNSDWSLQLIDMGFGTNWVILNTMSGNGNANITANPSIFNNGLPRSMQVRINYCGVYQIFTLTEQKYGVLNFEDLLIIN